MKWSILLFFAVLIFASGGCGGEDHSFDEEKTTPAKTGGETAPTRATSRTLYLAPSRDSGVSGTATLTDVSGGLEIVLNLRNLTDQPGARHLAHVHEGGTCADDRTGDVAPILYTLYPVIAQADGAAFSASVIPDTNLARIFSGPPGYVDVHAAATGDETPPAVACADLAPEAGNTAYTETKEEAR